MNLLRLICLAVCIGFSLCPVGAEKLKPATGQIASNVTLTEPNTGTENRLLFIEDNSGLPHPDGAYRFTVRATVDGNLQSLRLLVARSATPDFTGAKWESVPLKDPEYNTGNDTRNIVKVADVALGSKTRKYLAVKAEFEATATDGTLQKNSSAITVLPKVKAWSGRKADGSRVVYTQPSETAQSVRLWVARSATRNFTNARWQLVQTTPPQPASWDNFSATVPASPLTTPYVAVYGEADFEGVPAPARVVSPTLIWNGLPLPANASKIKDPLCPLHNTGEGVVPVIYGLAGMGGPKDAVFAGCIVGPGSPTWHCRLCDCSWGDAMPE